MIATGRTVSYSTSSHVEVINTETIESCSRLPAPFPQDIELAVSLTYQERVVICGGRYYWTPDCYSYNFISDSWQLEPFKLEPPRMAAVSVEIRPDEWMILGGPDSNYDPLADTKIFKDGVFIQGPDLPVPMYYGSGVMLYEDTLFIADGDGSSRNFLLDINTYQWTEIASRLLQPFEAASCGTFFNSSADEIQIAHIGFNGLEVYSPRDDSWRVQSLPASIKELHASRAIQQGPNAFVLIGGSSDSASSGAIYHFDESGLKIIKENVLVEPRFWHIAMPIPEAQFSC